MEDVQKLESLLEEKSVQVSTYLNESVAKREQVQEHLTHKIEDIKSTMTRNSSCIQKLRSKIAKGVEINFLTQKAVSFSSIMKDLEKSVQDAKKEVEEADQVLHYVVTSTEIPVL